MSVVADHPGVSTLAGTPKEVRARLGRSHAEHVLVLAFDQIKPTDFEALAENFTNVASSMFEVLLARQDRESLERLAEVLVPRTPPSPRLLKEAVMLVQARKAVLESGDWLTAAEVAQLAGLSTRNPSAQPNKWKKQGQIFAIHHNGVDYFPGYGLNREADFRPLKALARIIEVFAGHKDSWGMAYWFRSDNSYLGGQRPQDLLANEPEQVIEAALDEVQEIAHG
ncbi:XRE family transcriptional regulator [Halopseudomonas bauzanensis]|nr:XRE family transcriptional regulator [Halopseudomonas bauzanensis]